MQESISNKLERKSALAHPFAFIGNDYAWGLFIFNFGGNLILTLYSKKNCFITFKLISFQPFFKEKISHKLQLIIKF